MADRRRRLRLGTLAPVREGVNCRSRCFTKHKNGLKFPTSLHSRQLVFPRKGLDDFRKGCPPCTGLVTQVPVESFLPQIYHRAPQLAPKKRQIKLLKEADLLSKLSPAQQARKAFLEDVEAHLTPHPLALYPNLEEAMPIQLLSKVLEVLDPDQKLEDTWAYCQDTRKGMKEPTKLLKKHSTQVYLGPSRKTSVSNTGQWLYEEKPHKVDLLHENGPRPGLHENVCKAVSDFCKWVTTFGISDIDEEFILKQFDIDYETKPSHDVLHTMKLNQVPLELKRSVGLSKLQEPELFQKLGYERKLQKPQEELLADLHGTVAFKDFILSRGYRMPRFLENMYIGKECKRACNKTPIKRTQA
nr:protein FAM47E isoform X3 [Pan paniscus]